MLRAGTSRAPFFTEAEGFLVCYRQQTGESVAWGEWFIWALPDGRRVSVKRYYFGIPGGLREPDHPA